MAGRHDYTLLLLLLALFVFNSPFSRWWTSLGLPWYSMYLGWLILIALIAVNQFRDSSSRGD